MPAGSTSRARRRRRPGRARCGPRRWGGGGHPMPSPGGRPACRAPTARWPTGSPRAGGWFLLCLSVADGVAFLLTALVLWRRPAWCGRWLPIGLLSLASLPVMSWLVQLVPWWRAAWLFALLVPLGAGALGVAAFAV